MIHATPGSALLALSILLLPFVFTFVTLRFAIPAFKRRGIVGKDMHKPGLPLVADMGGLILVAGFASGMLLIVAYDTFLSRFLTISPTAILAVLCVALTAGVVGLMDDVMKLPQGIKVILPLFVALPLVAARVGNSVVDIPIYGAVDFGIVYSIVLVPLGLTGAANAVNMLAGFNGVEAGVGIVSVASLAVVAYRLGEVGAFLTLVAAFGALLATLYYNWHPARVFIGDVGTLTIGAIVASAVIVGNFEMAGVIVIIPHMFEFLIKAKNRFPNTEWWLTYRDGKLFCPESGPKGLGQLVAKIAGGMKERDITVTLMLIEAACGAVAIWFYW